MIKTDYFIFEIVELSKMQEQILQKEYEGTILEKLGLSKKFLQKILCIKKVALRIGLIKLSTTV